MKIIRTLSVLSLGIPLLVASCAKNIDAGADKSAKADLSALKTYSWVPADKQGEQGKPRDKEVATMIETAIEIHLGKRGYEKAAEGRPADFQTGYQVARLDKIGTKKIPLGAAKTLTEEYDYVEGTLVVGLYEPQSSSLLWKGWSEAKIDPKIKNEDLKSVIDQAVEMMFSKLPARK